jgi:hypothetical protein
MLKHCPEDCGKKTFCYKGEPLPEDKTICYCKEILCPECGLPRDYKVITKNVEADVRIPTPKSTEQYWKGKVCICSRSAPIKKEKFGFSIKLGNIKHRVILDPDGDE